MATVALDGSPQASLIWVGLEGDLIVSGHLSRSRKVANLQRDPRLVLTIEAEGRTEHGLDRYLLIHGRAGVVEGGAAPLLQRPAHVYLGPEVRFPPTDDPAIGYTLRMTPERSGGVGDWVEKSGPARGISVAPTPPSDAGFRFRSGVRRRRRGLRRRGAG